MSLQAGSQVFTLDPSPEFNIGLVHCPKYLLQIYGLLSHPTP